MPRIPARRPAMSLAKMTSVADRLSREARVSGDRTAHERALVAHQQASRAYGMIGRRAQQADHDASIEEHEEAVRSAPARPRVSRGEAREAAFRSAPPRVEAGTHARVANDMRIRAAEDSARELTRVARQSGTFQDHRRAAAAHAAVSRESDARGYHEAVAQEHVNIANRVEQSASRGAEQRGHYSQSIHRTAPDYDAQIRNPEPPRTRAIQQHPTGGHGGGTDHDRAMAAGAQLGRQAQEHARQAQEHARAGRQDLAQHHRLLESQASQSAVAAYQHAATRAQPHAAHPAAPAGPVQRGAKGGSFVLTKGGKKRYVKPK